MLFVSTISITVLSGARGRCMTGNHYSLPRLQIERPPLDVDKQVPFDDVEELVIFVVLMPVIFASDHAEPNDRTVHLAECLVVPLVRAGIA
jgi:hypothetical protein